MKTLRSILIFCVLNVVLTQIGSAQWVRVDDPTGDIQYLAVKGSTLFAQTDSGFRYSFDYGLHWTQANAAFADSLYKSFSPDTANYLMGMVLSQLPPLPGNITNLATANVELSSLLTLLAGFSMLNPGTSIDSVLVSLDTGTTALKISELMSKYALYSAGLSGVNPLSGAVIPGILFSLGGGMHWISIYEIASTISIRMLEKTDAYLFAATNEGIYRTNNNGGTWTKVNSGLGNTDAYGLASVNTVLFAGTDGGIYRTTDNGVTWHEADTGLTSLHVRALAASGANLFAGTHAGGVFLSSDNGLQWMPVNEGLSSLNVNALVVAQGNLYAGTSDGLWMRPLTEMVKAVLSLNKTSMAFPSTRLGQWKDTTIIVTNLGTDTLRVTSITSTQSSFSARPTMLNIAPGQAKNDTIRFTPNAIGTRNGKIIMMSNDALGPDTVNVSGYGFGTSILSLNTTSITFPPTIVGQWKDTTVTVSNTGTDTLKITSITGGTGRFNARPIALTIPPGQLKTDTIRFQPDAEGNFKDTLYFHNSSPVDPMKLPLSGNGTTTGVVQLDNEIPKAYTIHQNYPNPFNPSTTIRYGLPTRSRVRLQVFNILGQVLADLVSTEQAAGWNQVVWNANVTSGMYFYRIEAVSVSDASRRFVDVKKMVLLK